jgi:flagellin FlaB
LRRFRKYQKGQIGIGTMIVFIAMVLIAAVAAAVMIHVSNELQHRARATGMESVKTSSTGISVDSIVGYAEAIPGTIDKVGIYIRPYAGGEYVSVAGMSIEIRVGEYLYTYRYNPAFFDAKPPGNIFESEGWPSPIGAAPGAAEIEALKEEIAALEGQIADEEERWRPKEEKIAAWEEELEAKKKQLGELERAPPEVEWLDSFGCIALSDPDGSMGRAFPAMTPGDVAILTISTGGRIGRVGERQTIDGKIYCESGIPAVIRFTTPSGVPHKVFDLM